MDKDIAIKVDSVNKDFLLPHERTTSLKSGFTSFFRSKDKKVERQRALDDINFEVKKGEFFGIVGRNGSGKSTLLKIIAGIYQPSRGSVLVNGKLVPFIELGVGFNPELTGKENVYLNGAMLGFSNQEISSMYKDIVDFAELERFMDQKLKNYSSGMQVRLAFSMATRAQADILLIDEVLAVGDADFQRKCFEYFKSLKKDKKTVVFVSHDMSAIREYCDRALLINDSHIKDIGSTIEIANSYNQLFIEGVNSKEADTILTKDRKRWGNGSVKIQEVNTIQKKNDIVIKVNALVQKSLGSVIYGLHIMSQDGSEITAMNNRMILQPDLKNLRAHEKIEFNWTMQNIFNDGKYFVTLTLVDEAGIAFDWFSNATSFRVKRAERSTTPVLPPVSVDYKILNKKENHE